MANSKVNKVIKEAKKLLKEWDMPKQAAIELACAGIKLTDAEINTVEKTV